jgi:hypothetical protein
MATKTLTSAQTNIPSSARFFLMDQSRQLVAVEGASVAEVEKQRPKGNNQGVRYYLPSEIEVFADGGVWGSPAALLVSEDRTSYNLVSSRLSRTERTPSQRYELTARLLGTPTVSGFWLAAFRSHEVVSVARPVGTTLS